MSHGDFAQFASFARSFGYKRLRAMFATNSIKLVRASGSSRGGPYIWIDPPWELWNEQTLVASSFSYPDPHRVVHWYTEPNWFKDVRSFQAAMPQLLSVSYRSYGSTRFKFARGWVIESLDSHTPPDQDWYQDWYARGT